MTILVRSSGLAEVVGGGVCSQLSSIPTFRAKGWRRYLAREWEGGWRIDPLHIHLILEF